MSTTMMATFPSPSPGSSRARRKGAKVADLTRSQLNWLSHAGNGGATDAEFETLLSMARRTLAAEAECRQLREISRSRRQEEEALDE